MLQKFTITLFVYDKYDFYRNNPSSQLILKKIKKRNINKYQDSNGGKLPQSSYLKTHTFISKRRPYNSYTSE